MLDHPASSFLSPYDHKSAKSSFYKHKLAKSTNLISKIYTKSNQLWKYKIFIIAFILRQEIHSSSQLILNLLEKSLGYKIIDRPSARLIWRLPWGLEAARCRFSTYYINCHNLIEQLKKAHFENRLQDGLKIFSRYRLLIIDEIGYLPMDIQGANIFFSSSPGAMKRLQPYLLQIRPSPSGMKSSRRLRSPPPSSTGYCITALSSTLKATVTGLKSTRST